MPARGQARRARAISTSSPTSSSPRSLTPRGSARTTRRWRSSARATMRRVEGDIDEHQPFTEKAQEALVAAQQRGRAGEPSADRCPSTCWRALDRAAGRRRPGRPAQDAGRPGRGRRRRAAAAGQAARRPTAAATPASRRGCAASCRRPKASWRASRTSSSAPSTCCSRIVSETGRSPGAEAADAPRRHLRSRARGARRGPRQPARHRPEPRGQVPGARALRPRPDRSSPARTSSIRSSAATRRSAASSRCCRAAPRTTRC